MTTLRIATRGSAQAQTQAEVVAAQLQAAHAGLGVELVLVETTGDRRKDVPLHVIGGQGVFVKEVQQAVLDGRADLAVHSAKDLPSTPTAGLVIAALTERRDPRDALIGCKLNDLPPGATSSPPGRCVAGPSSRCCDPTSRSSSCGATSTPASTRCRTAGPS